MFGRAYGDARMPNWPHWHRTPLPGIVTTGLRRDKGGNVLGQATFLSPFLLCYSSVWMVRLHSPFISGSIRISGLDGELAAGCLRSGPARIVFCFRCWRQKCGCWVAAAMGRPCRSRAITILRRIVRVTKAATWSPPALFSIIGTKLSGVRGGSPIFSRVVIASSRHSRNAGHSNRMCQALSSHPLVSQLEHSGYPPASCGTGICRYKLCCQLLKHTYLTSAIIRTIITSFQWQLENWSRTCKEHV